jgi:O-antigen ligase
MISTRVRENFKLDGWDIGNRIVPNESMMKSIIPKLYFLFLYAIASKIVEGTFGEPRPSALSSDTVHFVVSTVLMGWTAALVYPRYQTIKNVLVSHKLLLGLYLYATISCCWTQDPTYSLRLILLPLVLLVSSAYLAITFTPEEMVELVAKVTALFAVGSIAGQLLLYPISDTVFSGWMGLYGHKEYLGSGMAIGIVSLLALRSKWKFSRWCMLILLLTVLMLARSATATLSTLSIVGFVFIKRVPRFVRFSLPVVIAVAIVSLIWTSNVENFVQGAFSALGKDTTLTGRDVIWNFVFVQTGNRPILGYGYQGFWFLHQDTIIANLGWNPGHAHNGFLNIALTLGLMGLFALALILWDGVRLGRRVRVSYDDFAGGWLLWVMWLELLNNSTSVDYLEAAPLWILFVVGYFSCTIAERGWGSVDAGIVGPATLPEGTPLHSG